MDLIAIMQYVHQTILGVWWQFVAVSRRTSVGDKTITMESINDPAILPPEPLLLLNKLYICSFSCTIISCCLPVFICISTLLLLLSSSSSFSLFSSRSFEHSVSQLVSQPFIRSSACLYCSINVMDTPFRQASWVDQPRQTQRSIPRSWRRR